MGKGEQLPNTAKSGLHERYFAARQAVERAGYAWEIEWQQSRDLSNVSETDFLRESAWVILCSGFREQTVRRLFGYIALCFCDFESAQEIVENAEHCVSTAMIRFKHERKLRAITRIAATVAAEGFESVARHLRAAPIEYLSRLYYIGGITCHHLAKNLGVPVAKSDRHLDRMAQLEGYSTVAEMCADIAKRTGDPIAVVDVVLWRSAVLTRARSVKFIRAHAKGNSNGGKAKADLSIYGQ